MLTPVATAALTPADVEAIELVADQEGLSEYHARFVLPLSVAPGVYRVSVANELGLVLGQVQAWTSVDFFESPAKPHVTTIEVVTAVATEGAPAGSAAASVVLRSFQGDTVCARVPPSVFTMGNRSRMPPLVDSTSGLATALAAARKAGGGTVFFPRGQYFLRGSFEIPPNTYLKGDGQVRASLG